MLLFVRQTDVYYLVCGGIRRPLSANIIEVDFLFRWIEFTREEKKLKLIKKLYFVLIFGRILRSHTERRFHSKRSDVLLTSCSRFLSFDRCFVALIARYTPILWICFEHIISYNFFVSLVIIEQILLVITPSEELVYRPKCRYLLNDLPSIISLSVIRDN